MTDTRAPQEGQTDIVERPQRLLDYKTLTSDDFNAKYPGRVYTPGGMDPAWHDEINTLREALGRLRASQREPVEPAAWLLQSRCKAEAHEIEDEWRTEDFAYDKEWRDRWLSYRHATKELRAVPLYATPPTGTDGAGGEREALDFLVARGVIHPSRLQPGHTVSIYDDGGWHMKHPLSCELAFCRFDRALRAAKAPMVPGEYFMDEPDVAALRAPVPPEGVEPK